MSIDILPLSLLSFIVNRINVGIFVVDRKMNVLVWNKFMEIHSGVPTSAVFGKNLFDCFPELPKTWLERKIKSVFLLKNFAFTSWQQRPYLFPFKPHRPITGGVDYMQQDCTFLPVKNENNEIESVCITLVDVTETCIYQTMLKDAMVELENLSQKDALTGLLNRRQFEVHLQSEFKRATRYGKDLSFFMFDLDYFKKVNDTYGHLAGDEILRQISYLVTETMRETDIIARYGGEEFAVLMPEVELDGVYEAVERFRKIVATHPFPFEDQTLSITISTGITLLHQDMQEYNDLIQEADSALYQSKKKGRNRSTIFRINSDQNP